MPARVPIFPADVLRLIFEEVAGELHDKRADLLDRTSTSLRSVTLHDLGSCSLVCRPWRDVCYPVKWRSVILNLDADIPNDATELSIANSRKSLHDIKSFFSERPTLGTHVWTLSLSTEDFDFYAILPASDLAAILDLLPSLRRLFLWNVIVPYASAQNLPQRPPRTLRRLVCDIVSTTIESAIPIGSPSDLLATLNLFTRVDEVAIYGSGNYPVGAETIEDEIHPCTIGSLTIEEGGSFLPCLVDTLRRAVDPTSLHSLRLYIENAKTLASMSDSLKVLATGLRSLTLSVDAYFWEPEDDLNDPPSVELGFLCCFSRLEEFALEVIGAPGPPRGDANSPNIVCGILSNILTPTSALRRVKVQLHYLSKCKMLEEFFAEDMAEEMSKLQHRFVQLPHLKKLAIAATIQPHAFDGQVAQLPAAPEGLCNGLHDGVCECDLELNDDPEAVALCARLFPDLHRSHLLVVEEAGFR